MREYEVEIVHVLTVTQRRRVKADSFVEAETIAGDRWERIPDEASEGTSVYCHVDTGVRKYYTRMVGTGMHRTHSMRVI